MSVQAQNHGVDSLEVRMSLEESSLSFCCLAERHLLQDLLLAPALDDHVAFPQVDDFIVDDVDHHVLCAFVHQVRLGQNS